MTPPVTKWPATEKTPLLADDGAQQSDASTLLTVRFGSPEQAWFGYDMRHRLPHGMICCGR